MRVVYSLTRTSARTLASMHSSTCHAYPLPLIATTRLRSFARAALSSHACTHHSNAFVCTVRAVSVQRCSTNRIESCALPSTHMHMYNKQQRQRRQQPTHRHQHTCVFRPQVRAQATCASHARRQQRTGNLHSAQQVHRRRDSNSRPCVSGEIWFVRSFVRSLVCSIMFSLTTSTGR